MTTQTPSILDLLPATLRAQADPALGTITLARLATMLTPAGTVPDAVATRWQDAVIEAQIPHGASVLDLGCGNGDLLHRLGKLKQVRGQGLELDPLKVRECIAQGIPVIQSDLDAGLDSFPDQSFDYVILEETLQTLHHPLNVLREMLRVGKHGIVSFPNFGCWKVRLDLACNGRMPVTPNLPYHWYDTPNIHLLTLLDFFDWASEEGIQIGQATALAGGEIRPLQSEDSLLAEEVLLTLLGKREAP
jgi:methionine biosynthesis protein MetW